MEAFFFVLFFTAEQIAPAPPAVAAVLKRHYSGLPIDHRVYVGHPWPVRFYIDTTIERADKRVNDTIAVHLHTESWVGVHDLKVYGYEDGVHLVRVKGRWHFCYADLSRPWDGRIIPIRRGGK